MHDQHDQPNPFYKQSHNSIIKGDSASTIHLAPAGAVLDSPDIADAGAETAIGVGIVAGAAEPGQTGKSVAAGDGSDADETVP
jgi:hypothetical protein